MPNVGYESNKKKKEIMESAAQLEVVVTNKLARLPLKRKLKNKEESDWKTNPIKLNSACCIDQSLFIKSGGGDTSTVNPKFEGRKSGGDAGSTPLEIISAFLLIGSPWIFWLFTYIYTCFKPCCLPHRRLPLQWSHHGPPPAATALPELTKKPSMEESPVNTPTGDRRVHFGGAVVVDNVKGGGQDGN
ncbi:hypothetical protein LguiA_020030 [Lonicera macranthoides]